MAGKRSGSRELVFTIDTGNDSLDLKEFAQQVGAIARTLDAVKARSKARVVFQVVRITRNSPYRVVVRETSDPKVPGFSATKELTNDLAAIQKAPEARTAMAVRDENTRWDLIESLSEIIVAPDVVRSVKIGRRIIGPAFVERLKRFIEPNERAEGSISGTLEKVDWHGKTVFWIFPMVGPTRVKCVAPRNRPDIQSKVLAGVLQYVTVHGTLLYRTGMPYAYAVEDVDEIEIHDEKRAGSLLDLKGIAPHLTGKLSTAAYLRELRHW